jgi:hypothetical protein
MFRVGLRAFLMGVWWLMWVVGMASTWDAAKSDYSLLGLIDLSI